MYQDKPKDTIIKKLKIDESYEDFPEFYLKNKEEIYKNVVLSFKSINRKDIKIKLFNIFTFFKS